MKSFTAALILLFLTNSLFAQKSILYPSEARLGDTLLFDIAGINTIFKNDYGSNMGLRFEDDGGNDLSSSFAILKQSVKANDLISVTLRIKPSAAIGEYKVILYNKTNSTMRELTADNTLKIFASQVIINTSFKNIRIGNKDTIYISSRNFLFTGPLGFSFEEINNLNMFPRDFLVDIKALSNTLLRLIVTPTSDAEPGVYNTIVSTTDATYRLPFGLRVYNTGDPMVQATPTKMKEGVWTSILITGQNTDFTQSSKLELFAGNQNMTDAFLIDTIIKSATQLELRLFPLRTVYISEYSLLISDFNARQLLLKNIIDVVPNTPKIITPKKQLVPRKSSAFKLVIKGEATYWTEPLKGVYVEKDGLPFTKIRLDGYKVIDDTTMELTLNTNFDPFDSAYHFGEVFDFKIVSLSNGLVRRDSLFLMDWPTATNETKGFEPYVTVFPNPGNGQFEFRSSSTEAMQRLMVYNTKGEIVYLQNNPDTSGSFDLHVPEGIYILEAIYTEAIERHKIVVTHP